MKVFVGVNRVAADMLSDLEFHGKVRMTSNRPVQMSAASFSTISDSLAQGVYDVMPGEVLNVCMKRDSDLMFIIPQMERDVVIPVSADLVYTIVALYSSCIERGLEVPADGFGLEWVTETNLGIPVEIEATEVVEPV